MIKRGGILFAVAALVALTGCSASSSELLTAETQAPAATSASAKAAPAATEVAVEQASVQIPTIRQGDYLTEVKAQLSSESKLNDIQLLAAGYEACLSVNESNKDAYRERVMSDARSMDAGLDQLVIAAGAKALLCP